MGDSLLPTEVLEVFQLSLKAVNAVADSPAPSRPPSPERQRLIDQILFSRRLILTYYPAVGVFILPFIVAHWYGKLKRSQPGRKALLAKDGADTPMSHASSSSGLSQLRRKESRDGRQEEMEDTPLLGSKKGQGFTTSAISRVHRHLKAFLMTQPEPIPALTAPMNLLPSYGTQSTILLVFAVNLFFLFYRMPLTLTMLFAFADRAGICFVVNLPILYLLAAKTNQPLQYLTGWSYEGLNLFHRRLGEWMIVLAALHGAGMMGAWYTLLRPLHYTLLMFLGSKVILLGIAAFVAYLAIYITGIGWVRRLYYETFLGLHIILQVAALIFLFFHLHITRPYVIASVTIWALDRIVARSCVSLQKVIATLEIASDQKTVLLFCDVQLMRADSSFKTNVTNGWAAGQHVFVTVPGIGWKHKLQAHPFTIASPAPPSTIRKGLWPLQLTIRAQDGFSLELLEYAKFHQHAEIYLDGPYGSVDVLEALRAADRVCLIAGGSGIAVTYPLSCALQVQDGENAVLSTRIIYNNGCRQHPLISSSESEHAERYGQLWVRQDQRSDDWIKYMPKANSMKRVRHSTQLLDGDTPAEENVVNLITSRYETRGGHRPDIKTELREWVKSGSSGKIVIVVIGPDGLVRDVRNGAASLVRAGHDIDVHVEKFGW